MRSWNDLFGDKDHILHEVDISVVHFARILSAQGLNRVLDWGCGAGRNLAYLARMGFEVSGMDPSERGINAARELMESEGLSAELDVVEPGQIPVEDESYDANISLYAIEHGVRDEVKNSVEELRRVLKMGGLSLVTLSSEEDNLRSAGKLISPGTYVPREGPEKGIAHYLAAREDIDEFFAEFEVLELAHVNSWLSTLNSDKRIEAHWVVIARKH